MKNIVRLGLVLVSCLPASRLLAQDAGPKPLPHFYHLVFQIEEKDGDGKVINSRSYSTMIATGNRPNGWPIKTGDKIPLHTGEKDIQYIDTGVNIDTRDAVEDGGNLHLEVKVGMSSVAPDQRNTAPDPIIRQNEWGAEVILPVGKPTTIFSSDNLENKGRIAVELTATRIP